MVIISQGITVMVGLLVAKALRRVRPEDHKLGSNLGYIANSKPAWSPE